MAKKNNRKANYQFGVRHQANNANTKHAKMLAAAEKFGCFNMKHFGDGYHFMDFDPSFGVISGTKKWNDKQTLHEQMEEINTVCGKAMAIMTMTAANGDKSKARNFAYHFLVENMISFMIHHDSEEAVKEMVRYMGFLLNDDPKHVEIFNTALNEVKDMLHDHTDVYKIQYNNVEEIFQATDLFELILSKTIEAFLQK